MRLFAARRQLGEVLDHLDAALTSVGLGWPLRVVAPNQRHITLGVPLYTTVASIPFC